MDISSGGKCADSESMVSCDSLFQHIVESQLAHIATSRQVFSELARRSIGLAEHSFSVRDINTLQEASRILINLPLAKARQIGRYYQAIAASRTGQTDEALSLLEAVADNGPLIYRARALQTLGSIYHRQGHHDEALRLYPEALRAASSEKGRDLLTTLLVRLDISCIKSETGDHRGALADYESLSPLVQIVGRENPLYFYIYRNELAVEFGELGRIAEAEAACAVALASPFAPAYPEWSATRDEIASKRQSATPSIVATARAPEADASPKIEPQRKPHRLRLLSSTSLASEKTSVQRASMTIVAPATVAHGGLTESILDWMRICIGPRAPPALS